MNDRLAADNLSAAIKTLYRVFEKYPLALKMDGSPYTIEEGDDRVFHRVALWNLTSEDLQKFAYRALTTWGTEDDFKHFLPRLLELMATDEEWLPNHEMMGGKLHYAEWLSWPEDEVSAIRSFLQAWWIDALSKPVQKFDSCDNLGPILGVFAQADIDLKPYIEAWRADQSLNSAFHLTLFYQQGIAPFVKPSGQIELSWWKQRESQKTQLMEWLFDARTIEFLEQKSKEPGIGLFAEEMRTAIEELQVLRNQNRN